MTTPTERILGSLAEHACVPRRSGKGWSARCPAHDDRKASLSVAEGDDGRVLVNCHAGCTVNAITAALGLKRADLFVAPTSTVSTSTVLPSARGKREYSRRDNGKPPEKKFATARDAVAELERQHGQRSALWTYDDASCEPVGVVVRWDLTDGRKEIRPVSRNGEGWFIGGMPEPRVLYALTELIESSRVYVCEGEKAADAVRAIGLTATTSAHGSQSADKADWSPLAGKECVILPDNDPAGAKYADDVAAILAKLARPAVVKRIDLHGLPEGGDVVEWIGAHGEAAERETLRQELESLADAAEVIQPGRPQARLEQFRPFPTIALPKPVRGFVVAGSKAIGCDPSYLALPMLTALAAAIGNTRRLQLKRGWAVPSILWGAIVGDSGTSKTPAFKLVMRPVRERQRRALDEHKEAVRQFEVDQARYEKEFAEWKRTKNSSYDPPEKPEMPQAERFVVSDTTVEAMAPLLLANPRGLLMSRDELAGWFGSFDKYSGGKGGADAAHWLSMHNGESIVVDRKTGNPRTIYVPHASVSVCGGIQPAILDRALGIEHRESGLAARLLLTCPPRQPKRWTEADIDPAAEAAIVRLFDRLYEIHPAIGDDGEPCPLVIGLTPDAKELWKAYYNSHAEEQVNLTGDLSAAWSKLEEYAARLALVLHFARWAADDPTLQSADVLDAASMAAGIQLAEWFKNEAKRVYSQFSESEEQRDERRLIEWIERKGEPVTSREVQQGCRWLREPGLAEAALERLVKSGAGTWQPSPPGQRGQPTRRFVLSTVYGNTPNSAEEGNTVDVDSVDAPDDEWGAL